MAIFERDVTFWLEARKECTSVMLMVRDLRDWNCSFIQWLHLFFKRACPFN